MWRLLLLAPVAATALAGSAQACTSGIMKSYFSYQRPVRQADMALLRVRVDDLGVDGSVVSARLDEGFAHLSSDGRVRIVLPIFPAGSNCLLMGPTDGPVFVVGRLRRSASGEPTLLAAPTRTSPVTRPLARNAPGYYDQYIVDPAYLTPAERRRREERHDRP